MNTMPYASTSTISLSYKPKDGKLWSSAPHAHNYATVASEGLVPVSIRNQIFIFKSLQRREIISIIVRKTIRTEICRERLD